MRWPLDDVYVTQEFGLTPYARAHPERYAATGGIHEGIDLRAKVGTPVYSPESGYATSRSGAKWGRYVKIEHQPGLDGYLSHMSSVVVNGDHVQKGQLVGYSGSSGNVAPHVHWSIRKAGSWVDPRTMITPDTPPIQIPEEDEFMSVSHEEWAANVIWDRRRANHAAGRYLSGTSVKGEFGEYDSKGNLINTFSSEQEMKNNGWRWGDEKNPSPFGWKLD